MRKLTDRDREIVLQFLSGEAAFNLFIIGDILNDGFDKDYMDVWGDFDSASNLTAVLLRYFNNYIPYYCDRSYNPREFINIIRNSKGKKLISGKEEILSSFTNVLGDCVKTNKYFCELKNVDKLPAYDGCYIVKRASARDINRLSAMIDTIEEFENTGENRDMLENTIKSCSGRYCYIEDEKGHILSVAGTSAENPYAAMIVSVATVPEARRQGLARACLVKLCGDVLKSCKNLCLFYSNPEAGSIYHDIGFETIGIWTMLSGR